MITFAVRMRFASEDREKVQLAVRHLAEASRREPGCVTYVPTELADNPNMVLIFEQYKDDAALEAHRASGHFRDFAIGGLYQWMKERNVENMNALA
jgi:quinol monooxygenase YgiN